MQRLLGLASCAAAAGLAGCADVILLEIAGTRPVPEGVDALCVGVADVDPSGGQIGRGYRLEKALASLPQSLRIEAGRASEATVWVRGDRGGVPVVRDTRNTDFSEDVTLHLDVCPPGSNTAPKAVGSPLGPPGARLVASQGGGGQLVVAIGATESAVLDASSGKLTTKPGPMPPGPIAAAIAADVDGDCDDDVVIAPTVGPPVVWRRDRATFTATTIAIGTMAHPPVRALAAADVDRNGTIDLLTAANDLILLWTNDNARFTEVDIANNTRAALPTAIAIGDLDGDGNPDLVVGQETAPLLAWFGNTDGTFQVDDAAVPATTYAVHAMHFADADDDLDPDLAIAVSGGPMHLLIAHNQRLEDRSVVHVPMAPIANAIALGNWDGGCKTDAIVAGVGDSFALSADDKNVLGREAMFQEATDVVMVDLDDDGDLDAVIATAEGATWLAR